jgi:hypothetical protein
MIKRQAVMRAPTPDLGTAVWLVEHTALTFEQIASFCGMDGVTLCGRGGAGLLKQRSRSKRRSAINIHPGVATLRHAKHVTKVTDVRPSDLVTENYYEESYYCRCLALCESNVRGVRELSMGARIS